MALTETEALRAFAMMMNTSRIDPVQSILADDFIYASQTVLAELGSKEEFLDYMRNKLQAIRESGALVFAEMGVVSAYGQRRPCVVLAQGEVGNLIALILASVSDDKLSRLDLCIVPPPESAERSGDYPS